MPVFEVRAKRTVVETRCIEAASLAEARAMVPKDDTDLWDFMDGAATVQDEIKVISVKKVG